MVEAADSEKKNEPVKVGEVSVDSGCLLLSDPSYVLDGDMRLLRARKGFADRYH
jgi:hypothetical protein